MWKALSQNIRSAFSGNLRSGQFVLFLTPCHLPRSIPSVAGYILCMWKVRWKSESLGASRARRSFFSISSTKQEHNWGWGVGGTSRLVFCFCNSASNVQFKHFPHLQNDCSETLFDMFSPLWKKSHDNVLVSHMEGEICIFVGLPHPLLSIISPIHLKAPFVNSQCYAVWVFLKKLFILMNCTICTIRGSQTSPPNCWSKGTFPSALRPSIFSCLESSITLQHEAPQKHSPLHTHTHIRPIHFYPYHLLFPLPTPFFAFWYYPCTYIFTPYCFSDTLCSARPHRFSNFPSYKIVLQDSEERKANDV